MYFLLESFAYVQQQKTIKPQRNNLNFQDHKYVTLPKVTLYRIQTQGYITPITYRLTLKLHIGENGRQH